VWGPPFLKEMAEKKGAKIEGQNRADLYASED
jgi:hypothetical protein